MIEEEQRNDQAWSVVQSVADLDVFPNVFRFHPIEKMWGCIYCSAAFADGIHTHPPHDKDCAYRMARELIGHEVEV